jgi:hypothetical protein
MAALMLIRSLRIVVGPFFDFESMAAGEKAAEKPLSVSLESEFSFADER